MMQNFHELVAIVVVDTFATKMNQVEVQQVEEMTERLVQYLFN
jgi:hypothetical protein